MTTRRYSITGSDRAKLAALHYQRLADLVAEAPHVCALGHPACSWRDGGTCLAALYAKLPADVQQAIGAK